MYLIITTCKHLHLKIKIPRRTGSNAGKAASTQFFSSIGYKCQRKFYKLACKKNSTLAEVCNTAKHSPKKQILVILATTMEVLYSS